MKLLILSVLVVSGVVAYGCSQSDSAADSTSAPCVGPSCQNSSNSGIDYDLDLTSGSGGTTSTSGAAVATSVNRCGLARVGCSPDDDVSCKYATVQDNNGTGGATSAVGPEDFGGSSNGGSSNGGSGNGGSSNGGSGNGGSGNGGSSNGGAVTLACRIRRDNSVPLSQCEIAGSGLVGDPCVSSVDCAPGFACAEDNGVGQCRHYCCGGNELCPSGTYCDERIVKEEVEVVGSLTVPVCVPAVSCRFDEPYPCPADQICSCPTGKVCGVVRADGTTGCVVPGAGLEGDLCPCAAGHICSEVLGTCVKTCSLTNVADNVEQCSLGVCQSSASLPADVGICVNSSALN
jgi:hypothetical protein